MLREMVINFPKGRRNFVVFAFFIAHNILDQEEMLEIPGIDPERVNRYGHIFLKLVRNAQEHYESMMRQQEHVPQDPNHENVIDISSGEENYAPDFESDDDDDLEGEGSRFFQTPADVEAFNARRQCCPKPFLSSNG